MSCTDHRNTIDYWSPGGPDLPDSTALHLDACAACTTRFEQRFTPITTVVESARTRRIPWRALAAAALVLFLALPSTGPASDDALDLSVCFEEVLLPPVCEV